MSGEAFVAKQVIVVRSGRRGKWTATLPVAPHTSNDRILKLLHRAVDSADYRAQLRLRLEPGPSATENEGFLS